MRVCNIKVSKHYIQMCVRDNCLSLFHLIRKKEAYKKKNSALERSGFVPVSQTDCEFLSFLLGVNSTV